MHAPFCGLKLLTDHYEETQEAIASFAVTQQFYLLSTIVGVVSQISLGTLVVLQLKVVLLYSFLFLHKKQCRFLSFILLNVRLYQENGAVCLQIITICLQDPACCSTNGPKALMSTGERQPKEDFIYHSTGRAIQKWHALIQDDAEMSWYCAKLLT